jgi:1,4-dihydroxy-2-naphthoyl-CoA hydrolase
MGQNKGKLAARCGKFKRNEPKTQVLNLYPFIRKNSVGNKYKTIQNKTMIWTTPIDLDALNKRGIDTLAGHLGITFTEIGSDYLEAHMPIHKNLMQPMGIMHGGASCVLAETVGSVAANFCVDQSVKVCVGLDININHLRPVQSGILRARTTPLHLGKTTQVWDIKIHNEHGKLVAISRLTMSVNEKEKIK